MGLCRDFTPKTETHMENEMEASKTSKYIRVHGVDARDPGWPCP